MKASRVVFVPLVLAIPACPLATEAQQAGKVYRIGTLGAGPAPPPEILRRLPDALGDLGWIEVSKPKPT